MPEQQGLRAFVLFLGLQKNLFQLWNTVKIKHQPVCAIFATLNYPVWVGLLRKKIGKVYGLLRMELSVLGGVSS